MSEYDFVMLSGEMDEDLQYKIYPDIETALFIGREVDPNFPDHPIFHGAKGEVKAFQFPYSKLSTLEKGKELPLPSWYVNRGKRKEVFVKTAYEYVLEAAALYDDFYIKSASTELKAMLAEMQSSPEVRLTRYKKGEKSYRHLPYEADVPEKVFFETVDGQVFSRLRSSLDALSSALYYASAPIEKVIEEEVKQGAGGFLKGAESDRWKDTKKIVLESTIDGYVHLYTAKAVVNAMIVYELTHRTPPFLEHMLKEYGE